METLTADDSSGANPSSVKSDDSSPRHEGGRGSPPPNCAICLGTCRNKSFTDSCLHQFCFKCLLTWSKVKAECPLCKQVFKSIIHNVRSNHQYDEYTVEQHEETQSIDIDYITPATRRFRYRTTLTLPRRETLAIQQLLMQHYPLMADVFPPPRPPPPARRRSPAAFRRTVYRHNLWARPLPDFTGRFRDCTPDFYRYNDSQMHRLVPWLQRELSYLLNENVGHIAYVMTRILELLPQYHINSPEFREAMQRYFGERTDHFLHELYCFASTPYDMTGYDRNVQYTTDSRISTMVNEVISSSESEASVDSDIVMVSSSHPAPGPAPGPAASAGPSRAPPPVPAPLPAPGPLPAYPRTYLPAPAGPGAGAAPLHGVIPIETLSHSDSESDDEVLVVGYIKPPAERTPEVVDLLGSDSDVVLNEPQPEPAAPPRAPLPAPAAAPSPAPAPQRPLVKLCLKRRRADGPGGGSPAGPRARRPRSATTSDTSRSTPSPSYSPTPSGSSYAPSPCPAPSPPTASSYSDWNTHSDSSSGRSFERRRKLTKRKSKRRTRRDSERRRRRRGRSRRCGSSSRGESQERRCGSSSRGESQERRAQRKSLSGKGVKSSRRPDETAPGPGPGRGASAERADAGTPPLPAGAAAQPGPSAARSPHHRHNCKRLRSVVNVMYHTDSSPGSSTLAAPSSPGSPVARLKREDSPPLHVDETHRQRTVYTDTDSDDDLPLNLSIQKSLLGSVVERCPAVPLCDVMKFSPK